MDKSLSQQEKAITILKKRHPWLYTDMTEPLRLGTADRCIIEEDYVIIRVAETWIWAVFSDSAEEKAALRVKSLMKEHDGLCLHCDHDPQKTRDIFGIKDKLIPCYIAVINQPKRFEINTDALLRPLTHEYDDFVIEHYRMAKFFTNPKETFHRLIDQGMTGAFIDEEIAGFIGSQPEGSIGMLEVMEKFRRRGIGKALEQFRINTYIDEGKVPYCHILENNAASLALEKALGYDISDKSCIYWLN
ncbi:MAG: GNAT family N-acetyltransferase [Sphaerochaetaceae bacterium]|nr:GNAT family N-acetyltransferase [Sphaerochaetaceae bacterium]